MSGIGEGDWVECVDAGPNTYGEPVKLQLGAVYRIESIVEARSADGRVAACALINAATDLHLRDGRMWLEAYNLCRFRPVYRPAEGLLQSLMRPAETVPA